MKEKKGFTLAELLIVVAIIAVLVAVSIPIFSVQLEKARDATSISNIRAAYSQAQAIALSESTSANLESHTESKGDGIEVAYRNGRIGFISISNVSILSKKRDNWSGMGDSLPFNLFCNLGTDQIFGKRDSNQGDEAPFAKSVLLTFVYRNGDEGKGTTTVPVGQLIAAVLYNLGG
ncbi:MAG: pilin [Erysipelotrichia bacterium]|nr:pilin [Erysipelotrichia bacterium]